MTDRKPKQRKFVLLFIGGFSALRFAIACGSYTGFGDGRRNNYYEDYKANKPQYFRKKRFDSSIYSLRRHVNNNDRKRARRVALRNLDDFEKVTKITCGTGKVRFLQVFIYTLKQKMKRGLSTASEAKQALAAPEAQKYMALCLKSMFEVNAQSPEALQSLQPYIQPAQIRKIVLAYPLVSTALIKYLDGLGVATPPMARPGTDSSQKKPSEQQTPKDTHAPINDTRSSK